MHEQLYRALYRIRRVEEEIARVYPSDKIKSPVHLSIGQEAVSVGVCQSLMPSDVVFGTYRSHALYLAKGGDLRALVAELYGKATGCAKGKGGSMHLIDAGHGIMGTSAVVGTTIPNAVGYAYALQYRKSDAIVVSFFGDGGVEEGVWHESLNFAALKALPVIFICENNSYAIHTHQLRRQPAGNICERARTYGMPAEQIGDDVLMVAEKVGAAVSALRAGRPGPFFFECLTYRWKEHVGPNDDFDAGYRTRKEAEPWFANDQMRRMESLLDAQLRRSIQEEIEAEIRDAFDFAERSPFPAPAELLTDAYEDPN
jgi:TPP-dependent pyruvate/acetoin dehydrogenase alpha subunit